MSEAEALQALIRQHGLVKFLELTIAACCEIAADLETKQIEAKQVKHWDDAVLRLTKTQEYIQKNEPQIP